MHRRPNQTNFGDATLARLWQFGGLGQKRAAPTLDDAGNLISGCVGDTAATPRVAADFGPSIRFPHCRGRRAARICRSMFPALLATPELTRSCWWPVSADSGPPRFATKSRKHEIQSGFRVFVATFLRHWISEDAPLALAARGHSCARRPCNTSRLAARRDVT